MERLKLVNRGGKDILIIDLSHCPVPEGLPVLERAEPLIRSRPPKSLLTLIDVSGSHYNQEFTDAVKAFARGNEPFVRATAVVGVSTIFAKTLISLIQAVLRRPLQSCDDVESALAWLSER
jgi:hypothetical protein